MKRGLYIHIPFCKSKCPYCDFYSFVSNETQKDSYLNAVLSYLQSWGEKLQGGFDTLYFGGGTPSCFGANRLGKIIETAKRCFDFDEPEITVECNPSSVSLEFFEQLKLFGVNRISMGMQSAVDGERQLLGRLSSKIQVQNAVNWAKLSGITNISLDLMLGVPNQTRESLDESLEFLISQDITHISAYMLKIEEGTPFEKMQNSLKLADEDEVCELYEYTIKKLAENGFEQYEISNFSKGKAFQSRHNLKYWYGEQYLGIGASAHSFIEGKRLFYERNFDSFVHGCEPTFDSLGGDEEEYLMLRLRLNEGVKFEQYEKRYGKSIDSKILKNVNLMQKQGLMKVTDLGFSLTQKGFLLSNSVIGFVLN
ncbi:MAG: radical SAM family heme chaperone HemW [Clostridia bacterium]